jgi:hypothetical protein
VGASLLAKAVDQPPSMLDLLTLSRAGSLPQFDCIHRSKRCIPGVMKQSGIPLHIAKVPNLEPCPLGQIFFGQ